MNFLILFLTFINACYAWNFENFKEEASSPVTTDAQYVLYGGTALTITILIFEDAISDPFQVKQSRNKTLGDTSTYGDILGQLVPNLLYTAGMGIAGFYKDPKGYHRALGMFKATSYASGVTTALKYTAREPRPYDHKIKNSFPSGHTTTAFAFAGYVARDHGWAWGVPATLMASFIGYSRINDNRHWLHDVTAGATIGWVYGWGISELQARNDKSKKEELESTSVVPVVDSKTAGLFLVHTY